MKKFLFNQKSIRIITEEEVITAFPEFESYVIDTPENYVYLLIWEQNPTKELKFPQLLGPMTLEIAQQTIDNYHSRYREFLSDSSSNVVDFQKKVRE
jgi:hypothetical protein